MSATRCAMCAALLGHSPTRNRFVLMKRHFGSFVSSKMNQVFIVTPFGTKNGIDFFRVERELIQPAIEAVGFSGGTTGEIIKQGNIRTDMFQKLLVADLVIADISIHNANAFYELGARHAFREKRSFLIRCSKESLPAEAKLDEVPFDLKTDRYFEYQLNDLAGSLPKYSDRIA